MSHEDFEDEDSLVDEVEEGIAPSQPLDVLTLLSDFFTNVGTLFEQIAVFPNDIALRIQGHIKWRNGQRLDMEEAARDIERIENFANQKDE